MFPWRGANAPSIRVMAAILRERLGSAMAKKTRKSTAAKATKKSKASTRKKGAKTKGAVSKKRRKVAAQRKKSKPLAKKNIKNKKTLARKKIRKPPPESFSEKVAEAFTAVVDTLTDAERLHHKLDPDVSREPE